MRQKSLPRHSLKLKGNPWEHRGMWRQAFGSGVCEKGETESPGEEEAAVNTFPRGEISLNFMMILTPRDSLLLFYYKNEVIIFPY